MPGEPCDERRPAQGPALPFTGSLVGVVLPDPSTHLGDVLMQPSGVPLRGVLHRKFLPKSQNSCLWQGGRVTELTQCLTATVVV